MEQVTRADAHSSLRLLAVPAASCQADITHIAGGKDPSEDAEEFHSDCPIVQQCFEEGGRDAILQTTNCSLYEFHGM